MTLLAIILAISNLLIVYRSENSRYMLMPVLNTMKVFIICSGIELDDSS